MIFRRQKKIDRYYTRLRELRLLYSDIPMLGVVVEDWVAMYLQEIYRLENIKELTNDRTK